jgi:SOS-response transcriptional repressor LexA
MTAKKSGKPKKAAKAESELQELIAKAVRRGDKLGRTLTQIVTQTKLDSSHPVHTLLKALDKNISKLRLHGEAPEQRGDAAKVPERKTTTESAPSASAKSDGANEASRPARARRSKKPAPAGLAEGEAAPASEPK